MSAERDEVAVERVVARVALVLLVGLLCIVPGMPRLSSADATGDISADAAYLKALGIVEGFPASWLGADGPVSKEEAVVLGARLHAYVALRVGEGDNAESLDHRMNRMYAMRPKDAGPLWGIPPSHWAYPAALYLQWVDGVKPGRAAEMVALEGTPRSVLYRTARSVIERVSILYEQAKDDPMMQWEVK